MSGGYEDNINNWKYGKPGSDTLYSQLGAAYDEAEKANQKIRHFGRKIGNQPKYLTAVAECSVGLGMVNVQWVAKSDNPI